MKNPLMQARNLAKLQQKQKAMQKKMKAILVTGKSKDSMVSMTLNGAQELEDVVVGESLMNVDSQRMLVKGIKQAYKSAQRELQKKMMEDFDISKIKEMLG